MSAPTPTRDRVTTAVLLVAGGVIAVVGAWALVDPATFHEAVGVTAPPSVDAASETRAAGALLLALGAYVVRGGVVPTRAHAAAGWGAVAFLAYATGRLLGLVADGRPGAGLVQAAAIEAALGLACLAVRRRTS